jgi:cysteine desulfurase / selenocysteine lyase
MSKGHRVRLDFSVRTQFPSLRQSVRGVGLTYLDSAATTLKPQQVVDRVQKFLLIEAANVHRGAYALSDQATENFETVRKKVATFLGAQRPEEVVFTYGTTDGLNLLAHSLGETVLKKGDVVVLSEMEHHANLVPWHLLKERLQIELQFIPVTDQGDLDLEAAERILKNPKVKVLSLVYCSNTLGTVNDVAKLFAMCRERGILTICDAAQAVAAMKVDVQKLSADFLVFSGHKLFGPYGVGVLYGRWDLLETLKPFRGGGSMIEAVSLDHSSYLPPPYRFEAGTPNIEGVIGLGESLDFLSDLKWADIAQHEDDILLHATQQIESISGVRIIGRPQLRKNVLPLSFEWGHPSDVSQLLDQQGIAVRSGHLCTQPLLKRFGLSAVLRVSFSLYSNREDVDQLVRGLKKSKELLS